MDVKRKKVVCNSSPIINLSKINSLYLLEKLYGQVFIPVAVYNELVVEGINKKGAKEIKSLVEKNVIIIKKVNNISFVKALNKDLDLGESEVIALALQINAELIIVDELDARKFAELYELKKTGFIGILIKAKNEGYLSSVKEYIDRAIEEGFWLNEKLYVNIMKLLDEV